MNIIYLYYILCRYTYGYVCVENILYLMSTLLLNDLQILTYPDAIFIFLGVSLLYDHVCLLVGRFVIISLKGRKLYFQNPQHPLPVSCEGLLG